MQIEAKRKELAARIQAAAGTNDRVLRRVLTCVYVLVLAVFRCTDAQTSVASVDDAILARSKQQQTLM